MTCVMHCSNDLRARGFRITPQRIAILSFLHDSPGHFSPAEIYERVRVKIPGMNEATIYRTLEFLAENNVVLPSLTSNGHIVYEYAGHDHHHLICRDCGKTIQVEPVQMESVYKQLENETGFHLAANHLTFFGYCPECSSNS